MFSRARAGFTLVELMVVIAILGLLVSVLAFAVTRHFTKANADLDKVNMHKLFDALQQAGTNPALTKRLNDKDSRDKSGREFFEFLFQSGVLDGNDLNTVVSLGGGDSPAERDSVGKEMKLDAGACSFTAPKVGEFRQLLTGKERTVVFTFNSRNAHNYDSIGYGMLVAWSDGAVDYLTEEEAAEKYQISAAEWADPTQLYGKKKPFDHTFE